MESIRFQVYGKFSLMKKNNPSQFVDVTFTVTEGSVRFERDLLFEDAPGPRDHWPQCDNN